MGTHFKTVEKKQKAGFTWMKKFSLSTIGEFKTPINDIRGGLGETVSIFYRLVLNTWNNFHCIDTDAIKLKY